jgi:hypothetical protein
MKDEKEGAGKVLEIEVNISNFNEWSSALFRPYRKAIATFKECQDGTQRFQGCCKAQSKSFVLTLHY